MSSPSSFPRWKSLAELGREFDSKMKCLESARDSCDESLARQFLRDLWQLNAEFSKHSKWYMEVTDEEQARNECTTEHQELFEEKMGSLEHEDFDLQHEKPYPLDAQQLEFRDEISKREAHVHRLLELRSETLNEAVAIDRKRNFEKFYTEVTKNILASLERVSDSLDRRNQRMEAGAKNFNDRCERIETKLDLVRNPPQSELARDQTHDDQLLQQTNKNNEFERSPTGLPDFDWRQLRIGDNIPSWLGKDGFEEETCKWLDNRQKRHRDPAATEPLLQQKEVPKPVEEYETIVSEKLCFGCGCSLENCTFRRTQDEMWRNDDLTEEEEATYSKGFEIHMAEGDNKRLVPQILDVLKRIKTRLAESGQMSQMTEECLKVISSLAKGKSRKDRLFELDLHRKSEGEKTQELVFLMHYYRVMYYYPQIEVNSRVFDLIKTLLDTVESRREERRAQESETFIDPQLISFLIQASKDFEQRVKEGEEIGPLTLSCFNKIIHLAEGKNDIKKQIDGVAENNDLTNLFIYGLRLYVWKLEVKAIQGSEISIDPIILDVARRAIDVALSNDRSLVTGNHSPNSTEHYIEPPKNTDFNAEQKSRLDIEALQQASIIDADGKHSIGV